jgi:transcriptional regulator with XRE-family HTH domain
MKATFGAFIRQTRETHHFTQAECAIALGYAHRSSIHRLEKGERDWTLSNIWAFARMLNLKMSELLAAYEAYECFEQKS